MGGIQPIIVDVETCPIDTAKAQQLDEEARQRLANPIDSRIVAIGLRHAGVSTIWCNIDEREMLEQFWAKLQDIKRNAPAARIVGFNITQFDMPFIVKRSFIHDVTIRPFTLKELIDIREKVAAYQYKPHGKLKELAALAGLPIQDIDGSAIMDLCLAGEWNEIREYLQRDLEITDELYQRAARLNIVSIERW